MMRRCKSNSVLLPKMGVCGAQARARSANSVARLIMLMVIASPGICIGSDLAGAGKIAAQDKETKSTAASSQDKIKEAGRACFAALKEKKNDAAIAFEGSDVLKRNGEAYVLRIRTLKNDLSGSYLRTTYVCEVVETSDAWSVIRVDLPR